MHFLNEGVSYYGGKKIKPTQNPLCVKVISRTKTTVEQKEHIGLSRFCQKTS